MLGDAFITLDVTHIPPEDAQPGEPDDLVGGPQLLDALSVEPGYKARKVGAA